MNIMEISHCRKQFGENRVLKDISLSVSEGQVVSIIGPSGSGKSTLLRCATLLETMDGGSLSYMGKSAVTDVNGAAVYAPSATLKEIRGYFGLVFQNFNLFPHYNVLKNIAEAPMLIQKRPKDEVYETARELLKKMDNWQFVLARDYIACPKASGYRGLHLVMHVPVCMERQRVVVPVEIQLRTPAMDMWACVEHDLCYNPVKEA